jgi:transcriptional regulator with XRE-family HTH domain
MTRFPLRENFGFALRALRKLQNMPQEALDGVSSRTYISTLERGLKSPTLDKVDSIANELNVHPLVLVAYTYLRQCTEAEQEAVLRQVQMQLQELAKADIARRDV